jgi:alpha-L-fucosidase
MRYILTLACLIISTCSTMSQEMNEMWSSDIDKASEAKTQWFKDAKFGMFIHWGLYSKLAGEWNGKRYFGSGEWIMNQGRIPISEYKKTASNFNPTKFNAIEWAQLAKDAGIKYMVVTAKHHEGFSMYDSKVTKYDIVDATPYHKDPMKDLANETRKRGVKFGFYYSQFQDWFEPNGGQNSWDYDESKKDYQKYYQEKAIPQLKELMSNYGPLGIIWFDTPGGMNKEQTGNFVNELRKYQPNVLFSSRVGHGLGDYRDFGDSEMPANAIPGAWESIYTHNDSWGYIKYDYNFKTPKEIINLLVEAASKGGNLMLNIGPDGEGNIPPYSIKFLKDVGSWLKINGESIYGTTSGLIPQQPWGFSTSKPNKQYLHILNFPDNGEIFIPWFSAEIPKARLLHGGEIISVKKDAKGIYLKLPDKHKGNINTVIKLDYKNPLSFGQLLLTVSSQFKENKLEASKANFKGNAHLESFTYSHYFGDWKHTTCVTGLKDITDNLTFDVQIDEPGDYQVILEYNCPSESAAQQGVIDFNKKSFYFKTLQSGEFNSNLPMMFIKQKVITTNINEKGHFKISIRPDANGKGLFNLKSIYVNPVS